MTQPISETRSPAGINRSTDLLVVFEPGNDIPISKHIEDIVPVIMPFIQDGVANGISATLSGDTVTITISRSVGPDLAATFDLPTTDQAAVDARVNALVELAARRDRPNSKFTLAKMPDAVLAEVTACKIAIYPQTFDNAAALVRNELTLVLSDLNDQLLDTTPDISELRISCNGQLVHTEPWTLVNGDRRIRFDITAQEAASIGATGAGEAADWIVEFRHSGGALAYSNKIVTPYGDRGEYPATKGEVASGARYKVDAFIEDTRYCFLSQLDNPSLIALSNADLVTAIQAGNSSSDDTPLTVPDYGALTTAHIYIVLQYADAVVKLENSFDSAFPPIRSVDIGGATYHVYIIGPRALIASTGGSEVEARRKVTVLGV